MLMKPMKMLLRVHVAAQFIYRDISMWTYLGNVTVLKSVNL